MGHALTAVQKNTLETISAKLREKEPQISQFLHRSLSFERFHQQIMLVLAKDGDKLLRCSASSLMHAIREALAYDLELGSHRSEAYIVPYGREATLIPGYKGLVKFVRRTGQLESWDGEVVREGDLFQYRLGDDPKIEHIPADDQERAARPATHVYVIFRLTGGRLVRSVWTASKVDAHKEQHSPGWKSKDSPWRTNWDAMAIKTLVRDLINRGRLPMSESDLAVAGRADDPVAGTVVASRNVEQTMNDLDSLTVEDELPQVTQQPEPEPPSFQYLGVGDSALECALASCANLGEVSAIEEAAVEQSANDDDKAYARDCCEKRRAEIRASRSEEKVEQ